MKELIKNNFWSLLIKFIVCRFIIKDPLQTLFQKASIGTYYHSFPVCDEYQKANKL